MMRSIQINISDEIYSKFMGLLDILPKGSVEAKEITLDKDPYFDARKKMIEKRISDIDSGKMKTSSLKTLEDELNIFESELEVKYANQLS